MLKNRYQEVIVGMGILSLVRGIISLRRGRSTLLIDDKRFVVDSYPSLFLSELEILSLSRLGKRYDIPELIELRKFLMAAETNFVMTGRRLKLGHSPLENLKEVLRKYPELLDPSDYDQVYQENDEAFNKLFFEELSRFESLCYEGSSRLKGIRFELQGPKWLKVVYQRLGEFLNQEYQYSKDLKFSGLLHLLGVSAEEKLKIGIGVEEFPYYFFRALSPIYRLQDFFLSIQLKRRLALLGGDYKESTVQYWQFHENKFENLLLASFEGVISGDKVLFFSHLPEDVPLNVNSPFKIFRKAQLTSLKRGASLFPPSKLTYFTETDLLGSERPYRVHSEGAEFFFYHWPYPDLPGSKSEFYDQDMWEDFKTDSSLLPFEYNQVGPNRLGSVTLDLRSLKFDKKRESPLLTRLPMDIEVENQPVTGLEYWGPFRYRSLGLLSLCYGIEEN